MPKGGLAVFLVRAHTHFADLIPWVPGSCGRQMINVSLPPPPPLSKTNQNRKEKEKSGHCSLKIFFLIFTLTKIKEAKSWFSEKINRVDSPLSRLIGEQKEKGDKHTLVVKEKL